MAHMAAPSENCDMFDIVRDDRTAHVSAAIGRLSRGPVLCIMNVLPRRSPYAGRRVEVDWVVCERLRQRDFALC